MQMEICQVLLLEKKTKSKMATSAGLAASAQNELVTQKFNSFSRL
jgi:hypothetical protein